MQNHSKEVVSGQAAYTKVVLSIYDIWVLGISNSFIWKCPSKKILQHFNKNISINHLDIGVGTGYFLDQCNFSKESRIGLMDMNLNSIAAAANRISRYQVEKYQQNILEPVPQISKLFDSISLNYLFHCLSGTIAEKTVVFDHVLPLLNKGGLIFGSTILQGSVTRSTTAKKLMKIYNKKGIFCNETDTLEGLEASLKKRFNSYEIQVEGCVALFWAKNN